HRTASAVVLRCGWCGECLDDATGKRECAPKESAHADPHEWRFARRFLAGVGRRHLVPCVDRSVLEATEIRVQSENALHSAPRYPQTACPPMRLSPCFGGTKIGARGSFMELQ